MHHAASREKEWGSYLLNIHVAMIVISKKTHRIMDIGLWKAIDINHGPLTTGRTPASTWLFYHYPKTIDRGGPAWNALGGREGPCSESGNGRPDVYAYKHNTVCYSASLTDTVSDDWIRH